MVFKFQDDPTVNESEITVLLEQVGVYAGKRKLRCEGHFSHLRDFFFLQITMVRMLENEFRTLCSNFMKI